MRDECEAPAGRTWGAWWWPGPLATYRENQPSRSWKPLLLVRKAAKVLAAGQQRGETPPAVGQWPARHAERLGFEGGVRSCSRPLQTYMYPAPPSQIAFCCSGCAGPAGTGSDDDDDAEEEDDDDADAGKAAAVAAAIAASGATCCCGGASSCDVIQMSISSTTS